MMKIKRFRLIRIKFFIILIIFTFLLYTSYEKFLKSSPCSHLYHPDSFLLCASSNERCNITILLNAYLSYRTCVLEHRPSAIDYVVFDAVNGLGNRLLGLISVTTYALVTSRILLINWKPGDNHQAHFQDLFLPLSSFNEYSFYSQYSLSRITNLLKNRWINEIEWQTKSDTRIPRDWAFYFDPQILCNNYTYKLPWFKQFGFYILNSISNDIRWIRTDQYFVPLLTRNERNRQAFVKLFENGQIFAQLAKEILHPVPKVNSIVDKFQKEYDLNNYTVTIGIHMRSWSSKTVNYTEPFQQCIEHVIHRINRSNKEGTKLYLYVISNDLQRRELLENRISNSHQNIEILQSPSPPKSANTIVKMQYTLAELLILSKMKHLIITSKSTFGMIAQGLANKGAWIVRQGASNELTRVESNVCQWESTSEPEYQMIRFIQINSTCPQPDVSLPIVGERNVI